MQALAEVITRVDATFIRIVINGLVATASAARSDLSELLVDQSIKP